MVRPHPAVWRIIHGIIIVYLLICVFLLFQNVHDARKFLQVQSVQWHRPPVCTARLCKSCHATLSALCPVSCIMSVALVSFGPWLSCLAFVSKCRLSLLTRRPRSCCTQTLGWIRLSEHMAQTAACTFRAKGSTGR